MPASGGSAERVTFTGSYNISPAISPDGRWLAYFNDLHKGRNTGVVWTVFIDVVAAACLFFALTGLVLLWIQARQRKSTWPLVTGGVGLVVALMIFFAH